MDAIHGSCLCGAVEFEIAGRVSGVDQCHCSICRRASGTGCTAILVTAARSLRWISGERSLTRFSRPSGWASCFCPTCGSPAPRLHENGKVYLVPAGILDGDPGVRIEQHIFVASRAAWDSIASDGAQFDERPPDGG